MTDITAALREHIERARASPPPYVDMAAPEVILHLRVRLRLNSGEVIIEDDDAPVRISSLEGRLAQYGQEMGRINEALQARIGKHDELIVAQERRYTEQIRRTAATEGKVTGHEFRLNVYRERIEEMERALARMREGEKA